jgi:hypothetical protein
MPISQPPKKGRILNPPEKGTEGITSFGWRTVKIFAPSIRPPSCMTSKAHYEAPDIRNYIAELIIDQFQRNKLIIRLAFP